MLSRHLVLLSVGKALRTANQIRVTRGAHSSDSTNCWEGGKGGFGRSGTDFLVLYNQWQRNRFYFGEANQFQLSWEPWLRFSAKCKHDTQNQV